MAVRALQLYLTLRSFCLGAFVFLGRALEEGDELPFVFEEHVQRRGPTLYEYRPLVRTFIEARSAALARRDDAVLAVDELRRLPEAAIYAHAHAGARATEEQALFRTVLLSLLVTTAEGCGGFDWDDDAFERAYAELEASLFAGVRAYWAVAPLIGLSAATPVALADGVRIRPVAPGDVDRHWPEARGLLPPQFGLAPDRYCVLELERRLEAGDEAPDAPAEVADAVTAIRLATAAPVAAGPVVFERLDRRPFGLRPVLPIVATQPPGDPDRLDGFRGALAVELYARLPLAADDPALSDALDRWELSLFGDEPFRSAQLRSALESLLGETWALRAAVLVGSETERRSLHRSLRSLTDGRAAPEAAAAARRALVEVLRHGQRRQLLATLDETLLGLRTARLARTA